MRKSAVCPSCGGANELQSGSQYLVCQYCRQILLRENDQYSATGESAGVADDISPYQVGTEGWHNKIHFGLIGRLRLAWTDGFWNEWYVLHDDGNFSWLAEAQGELMLLTENKDPRINESVINQLQENKKNSELLGSIIEIENVIYSVADIKDAKCIAAEGELPKIAAVGREYKMIDLRATGGRFASLELDPDQKLHLYTGSYVYFSELKFSNLRELPGWKPD